MIEKFQLGQRVYLLHPQSQLRPYTIIDGIISKISEITTNTKYFDEYLKSLNGEKIEYEVKLTPSGTKIIVKEENIYSELCYLDCKVRKEVELQKMKLRAEAERLTVHIDI